MSNKIEDFGFFFEDDQTETITTIESTKQTAVEACKELYARIDVLLRKLESNPEKPTINWPDRPKHVAKFRAELQSILDRAVEAG